MGLGLGQVLGRWCQAVVEVDRQGQVAAEAGALAGRQSQAAVEVLLGPVACAGLVPEIGSGQH